MPPEGILPNAGTAFRHRRFDNRLIPSEVGILPQQLPAQIREDRMMTEGATEFAAMVECGHVRPDPRPVHLERIAGLISRGNFRVPKAGKFAPDPD